jgi:hypothetical protein
MARVVHVLVKQGPNEHIVHRFGNQTALAHFQIAQNEISIIVFEAVSQLVELSLAQRVIIPLVFIEIDFKIFENFAQILERFVG